MTRCLFYPQVGRFSQPLVLFALTAMAGTTASAANITWSAPQNITGASDVSTVGTGFGSWAPYNGGANTTPVNGVTFEGFDTLGISSQSFDGGGQYFGGQNTSDTNYNTLLSYGVYSNDGTAEFTLNGNGGKALAIGTTYQLQLWVSDPRNLGGDLRTVTFDGGAGTSVSAALSHPANGSGIGQYIIGTFTADAITQTIRLNANTSAQLNLVQVRELPVPEPSGVLLGSLCLAGAFLRRGR